MSHLLYRHRLIWDGRRGTLSLCGVHHRLSGPPAPFADANYIDYAPEVRVAQIRRAHGAMRDMTAEEIAQAEQAMLRVFEAGPVDAKP